MKTSTVGETEMKAEESGDTIGSGNAGDEEAEKEVRRWGWGQTVGEEMRTSTTGNDRKR